MKQHSPVTLTTLRTVAAVLTLSFANSAGAGALVFQGQNAALFPGANPSDTSTLMNSVPKPGGANGAAAAAAAATAPSPATLVEQAIESQISSKIYNDIFNSSATSGTFNLGGGNIISFVKTGGNIIITFIDPVHGTTTITVPDI